MKISYNWLKEYVNVKLAPEKLAQVLTMAGLSVEGVKTVGNDHIFEIEITANRPDWLSVIGVAREVAALTGARLKLPSEYKAKKEKLSAGIRVKVDDRNLCPRYTARIIRNVKVGESPEWLKARIQAMGLRPVNNIVDITNFCLFETGEPMHAFDLDKISGGEIVVRKATQGEKIVAIDGAEKALDNSTLVIADGKRPIAIAGVMGGLNTEVTNSTRNILLEAAFFDQISVRRTARKLAIATESSYRFERRVDIDNIVYSSDRALALIGKLAGGQAGAFIDIGAKEAKIRMVELNLSKVNGLLGADIPLAEIKRIVTALGMNIKSSSKDKMKLEMPGFRADLRSEVDIIEEIARVYGYAKIPTTLPRVVEQPVRIERDMIIRNKIRECLVGMGADEIITYSLLGKKMVTSSGVSSDSLVTVANPLTSEQEAMRPSLIPGMLNAILWNINRKNKDLKLFEIGNIYFKKDEKFAERQHLAVAITGQCLASWLAGTRQAGFFELKGMVEALFSELGIMHADFSHVNNASFLSAECAGISIEGNTAAGVIGCVSPAILRNFDIKEKVYLLEIDLSVVSKHACMEKCFTQLPKHHPVYRDISIVVAKETLHANLLPSLQKAAGALLKKVELIDRYEGKQVPEGKISLTYRLEYQDPARTLEDKDVLDAHSRVLRSLEESFGAKLR